MNKLQVRFLSCLALVLLSSGCGDDVVSPSGCEKDTDCLSDEICVVGQCLARPTCENLVCNKGFVCIDGECVEEQHGIPCGEDFCEDHEVCLEGTCVDHSELCGTVICSNTQVCLDEICVERSDLCGSKLCKPEEFCVNGVCSNEPPCGNRNCTEDEVCFENQCEKRDKVCVDKLCMSYEICINGECIDETMLCGEIACQETEYCDEETLTCIRFMCDDGRNLCDGECCDSKSVCDAAKKCCPLLDICADRCCGEGEVCENQICRKACTFSRCENEEGSEVCCEEGEVCTSNQCFKPSVSCVDYYDCENEEYCEATTHTCLPKPTGNVCASNPQGGAVIPTLLWHWGSSLPAFPNHNYVMSSPMVADVNRDGQPEVIFNSYSGGTYNGNGILRVVHGSTGETLASSDGNPYTDGGSQVAVGDVIPEREGLEIATCVRIGNHYKMALFDKDAKLIWMNSDGAYNECGQSGPGIADFNADGHPEIYSRYSVFNGQTGERIARVACGEKTIQHAPCDYPVATDVNGDGNQELVGGNVVYRVDFANKTLVPLWHRSDEPDGYPALADLNLDGKPELVTVRADSNSLKVFDLVTGANYWETSVDLNLNFGTGGGGPATVANVDDDPEPEITLAGGWAYVVFEPDGKEKWHRRTKDYSSKKTGSSIFDFDGDGKAEAVYGDECFLRVYDGETGNTRFCQFNPSATHWEYPVIADVNNDNHAEIVVSSNLRGNYDYCNLAADTGLDDCTAAIIAAGGHRVNVTGVRVFSSPNQDWVNTRKIYNQHAYSVTNVSDDGSIPKHPKQNWNTQYLNNFRLNIQPGATYLPDLEIINISTNTYACQDENILYFTVKNVGWAAAEAGVEIKLFVSTSADGPWEYVKSTLTTQRLLATASENLSLVYPRTVDTPQELFFQFTTGENAPVECNGKNNTQVFNLKCALK